VDRTLDRWGYSGTNGVVSADSAISWANRQTCSWLCMIHKKDGRNWIRPPPAWLAALGCLPNTYTLETMQVEFNTVPRSSRKRQTGSSMWTRWVRLLLIGSGETSGQDAGQSSLLVRSNDSSLMAVRTQCPVMKSDAWWPLESVTSRAAGIDNMSHCSNVSTDEVHDWSLTTNDFVCYWNEQLCLRVDLHSPGQYNTIQYNTIKV